MSRRRNERHPDPKEENLSTFQWILVVELGVIALCTFGGSRL